MTPESDAMPRGAVPFGRRLEVTEHALPDSLDDPDVPGAPSQAQDPGERPASRDNGSA